MAWSIMSENQNSTPQHCAIVVGVGASKGIGGAVCRRIAKEGLLVYIVGRTASKLQLVADEITATGGKVIVCTLDSTKPEQVSALFQEITDKNQVIDLVVHNVGSNMPSRFLTTSPRFLEQMWRATFFSGFLFGQASLAFFLAQQHGTLLFTGASGSMRGKPFFAAFTTGKSALRNYIQGIVREFNASNIHIAHIVIDGMVDGDRVNQFGYGLGRMIRLYRGGEKASLNVDDIADNYWQLHKQPKELWTHELDLRPFLEKF
jgi:short-subunit dehydrogenase